MLQRKEMFSSDKYLEAMNFALHFLMGLQTHIVTEVILNQLVVGSPQGLEVKSRTRDFVA